MMELRSGKKLRSVPNMVSRDTSRRCKKVGSVPNMVGRECDRLSEMPDEIIIHILSFLPIVDAVRTMLFRRFGNLWTLVPSLRFDHIEFYQLFYTRDTVRPWTDEMHECFLLFIRNVLLLHRSLTIDKFELSTSDILYQKDSKFFDDVQMWLSSASAKGVKAPDFKVTVQGRYAHQLVPKCVFTSPSLVTLELSAVQIECNHHQVHLGSLRKLSLRGVRITDAALEKLISGCPYLQELDVMFPLDELEELRFTNPSIEKLRLYLNTSMKVLDIPNVKKLYLCALRSLPFTINAPSLHHVSLTFLYSYYSIFAEKFRDVEVMEFTDMAFNFFSSRVKEIDYVPRNKWKRLILASWCLKNHNQLLAIYKFVTSSTRLEELVIYSKKSQSDSLESDSHLDSSSELPCCVMSHLKTVTIHGYESPNTIQLLIEFLLRSAIVLDELLIVRGAAHPLTAVEELKFVKEISSFQRASTRARVVFA